ncbi:MAG: ankyrin repeat domain-containing protein [Alphaproteobacteria bacterium]|nr:ankyrin repeat domain-containing protein [Alphaproteobacteria bacterium]
MRDAQRSLAEKLIAATAAGDLAAMRDLLRQGADANGADAQGFTPLMLAAYHWQIKGDFAAGVRLLLDARADVAAANAAGHTALMIAAIYGLTGMAEMLVAAGADPAKKSAGRLTAEDMALRNGHEEVAALLRQAAAERRLRAGTEGGIARLRENLKARARHLKKTGFGF